MSLNPVGGGVVGGAGGVVGGAGGGGGGSRDTGGVGMSNCKCFLDTTLETFVAKCLGGHRTLTVCYVSLFSLCKYGGKVGNY